jgi:hypothetical protein
VLKPGFIIGRVPCPCCLLQKIQRCRSGSGAIHCKSSLLPRCGLSVSIPHAATHIRRNFKGCLMQHNTTETLQDKSIICGDILTCPYQNHPGPHTVTPVNYQKINNTHPVNGMGIINHPNDIRFLLFKSILFRTMICLLHHSDHP